MEPQRPESRGLQRLADALRDHHCARTRAQAVVDILRDRAVAVEEERHETASAVAARETPIRRPEPYVERAPPGGTVHGTIRDVDSHLGVGRAIITFTDHPDIHILATAADGTFRSGRIPFGDYSIHVEADGYNPSDCDFTVSAQAAAVTSEVPATGTCELRPLPCRGNLSGYVTSSQGGAGVRLATVTVTPAPGFPAPPNTVPPSEQTTISNDAGAFSIGDLLVGPYLVSVGPTAQHMASMPPSVTVEPRRAVNVDVTVTLRPTRPSAVLRGSVIAIARQVHFQTNSAEILPGSNSLHEEFTDVIHRNNTSLTSVEIQGHTDRTGTSQGNMTLSQSRAESVRDALVRLGIPADKLTARGFERTRPLHPNLASTGRAINRRVELHVSRAR